MFGGIGKGFGFEPVFDLFQLVVEDDELLVDREAALNQLGNVASWFWMTWFSWAKSTTSLFLAISPRR